jgi:hypothetical protein
VQQQNHHEPIPIVDGFQPDRWMWAVRDAGITNPTLLLMAYHHLSRADDAGLSRPVIEELQTVLRVERTQVQNLRRKLVKLGFLRLHEKGNGPGEASVYRLTLPGGNPLTPLSSESAHSCSDFVSRLPDVNTRVPAQSDEIPAQSVSRFSEHQAITLPFGEREVVVEALGAHPVGGSPTERAEPSATRRAVATLGEAHPELLKPRRAS